MGTFCVLVAPLPHAARKRIFRFLSESPIVAKVAYALKISFMSVPPSVMCHSKLTIHDHNLDLWASSSQMPFSACSASPLSLTRPNLMGMASAPKRILDPRSFSEYHDLILNLRILSISVALSREIWYSHPLSDLPLHFIHIFLSHLESRLFSPCFTHSTQRNVYLTGFTLFLSLVLTRSFYITLDLINAQEENIQLKQKKGVTSVTAGGKGDTDEKEKELR